MEGERKKQTKQNKTNTNNNSELKPRIIEDNMLCFKHKQDLFLAEVKLHRRGITLYTTDLKHSKS
jgi:hypothetical protein